MCHSDHCAHLRYIIVPDSSGLTTKHVHANVRNDNADTGQTSLKKKKFRGGISGAALTGTKDIHFANKLAHCRKTNYT